MRGDSHPIEQVAAMFAWPYTAIYAGMWALAIATVRGATFLSEYPGCAAFATPVTPLWHCADSYLVGILANLANASLVVTLWVPSFIMAGLVDPYSATIALPILLVHAIGVPTTVYAIVQIMIALMERAISPSARALGARLRLVSLRRGK